VEWRSNNPPIQQSFLLPEKYPLFLQKSCIFCLWKNASLALFFPGNFDIFHRTEID